jgi:chitin disaccharide deacetylase
MRRLIVNADDFGLAQTVNDGIVRGHTHGIVTSTSLMVHQPAAEAAADAARSLPDLSVGLHVDIAEWERDGDAWRTRYQWVDPEDGEAVAAEVHAQLMRFDRLLGRPPTHLDSHQHVHRNEPLRSILIAVADRYAIPLRHHSPARYCGAFYGNSCGGRRRNEAISPDALTALIHELTYPLTELCCHPAADDVPVSEYDGERQVELASLCDPTVRSAITASETALVSFAALSV